MKILETERLQLRVWTLDDVKAGVRIWGDPEVMEFIDEGEPMDEEEVEKNIQAGISHQEKYRCQHWAVIEKDSGELIGCCGFNMFEGGPELELAYHFAQKYWGKGYATEAAKACLAYAFDQLAREKIVAGVAPENKASVRVLEKLGFTYQGMRWYEDSQQEEPFYTITQEFFLSLPASQHTISSKRNS